MTNLRDLAKFKADAASVVFEGTPTRITLAWDVLSAKPGKLISADFWSVERGFDRVHGPHLVVTFRVQRAYKGNPDGEIRINTGVATVDCSGRMFEPNIPYLVYAYGPPDNLWVSTCSPGGWMGSSSLEPELRYLRGERPTREDTASYRPQEDARADRRRFEASTGTICGKVRRGALRPDVFERVAFLPMAGYSPWSPDEAWPTGGGEFCHQVAPGKYYLGYRHSTGGNVDAAAFYPGVNELRSASLVEVKAGQTRSGLDFSIPAQVTHSVRGMVVVHDGRLAKQTVAVQLIDLDRIPGRPAYRREIEFGGWFPLSRVRYFAFDSVLPGRYVACTQAPGSGWLTTKVEIDVRSSSRTVVLDLLRK